MNGETGEISVCSLFTVSSSAAEMLLLHLWLLSAGSVCLSFTEPRTETVQRDTVATLRCPHAAGNVSWSRFLNGQRVTLLRIINGREHRILKRYGSLADNSLVIPQVQSSDSSWYFCNEKQTVYLDVVQSVSQVPVTRRDARAGSGLAGDQAGNSAPGDAEKQQHSDLWKVPVGVVTGAALVLSAAGALRLCSGRRPDRDASPDQTVTEVVYEEIEHDYKQPRRESENPYYWSSIIETPNTELQSCVHALSAECVYSLAQKPLQTGS